MFYLGIDLGTSSVKVIIMEENQQVLGASSHDISVDRPEAGWSEQDPAEWIRATEAAMLDLKDRFSLEFPEVKGISLAGQMHGATLLDETDNVLRPCMLWNDTRSFKEAELFDADPEFRRVTGNIVFPGFTAPKVEWIRNNDVQTFGKIRKVLLPKDYLRLWLIGESVSEMSDSAGTSWLDTGARCWSEKLLSKCELRLSQMPRLVEGTEVSGQLRQELVSRWGFSAVPVVVGGAGDNAASGCGMGTVSRGRAFVSLGTSGVLFAATASYLPNPQSAVHTFCHALPDTWHQMGVILSATDSLNWYSSIANKSAADLTQALGKELQKPSGVTFLPYLSGERTPHNDAKIRASFVGMDHKCSQNTLTQSVLEGVAFAIRDNLLALNSAGTNLNRVTAVGGGSRSEYWLQVLSTVLNLPVDIPAEGDFGAALGAARLALIGATGADPLEICTPPETHKTIQPELSLVDEYRTAYEQYRKLYPAIRSAL